MSENMRTAKITKIESDNECHSITFANQNDVEGGDFDLDQLGTDILFISGFGDMIMVSGCVTLKPGDSITDEFGGQPILGEVRGQAIKKDFSIKKDSDYRAAFHQKMTGEGEK